MDLTTGMRPSASFPEAQQPLAEHVRGNEPGAEDDDQRQHDAHAGHVHAEPLLGLKLFGQQQQRLIHGAHEQMQHPQRDAQRDPDQQPCDEIFFQLHPLTSTRDALRDGQGSALTALPHNARLSYSGFFAQRPHSDDYCWPPRTPRVF